MTSFVRRLLRRLRPGKPIVIVSGLPRSGTSMAMKMLEAGGLAVLTDGLRAADESNPNGYYELDRVLTLDKGGDTAWIGDASGKALKVVSALLPHLPETYRYKVIFMHRNLHEVLRSQNKMLEQRGESGGTTDDESMLQLYETHLKKIKNLLARRSCFECLDLQYQDVVAHPLDQARRIDRFLGGSLDVTRMAAAVNPDLYRNRNDR